jgi:hypothetical protein
MHLCYRSCGSFRQTRKKVIFFSFSACIAAAKQLLFGFFSLVEYDGKEKTPLCDEDMNERKKEKEKKIFLSSLHHKIKTCSLIRSSYVSKNIVTKKGIVIRIFLIL